MNSLTGNNEGQGLHGGCGEHNLSVRLGVSLNKVTLTHLNTIKYICNSLVHERLHAILEQL